VENPKFQEVITDELNELRKKRDASLAAAAPDVEKGKEVLQEFQDRQELLKQVRKRASPYVYL
jgi:hypothetical protein